MQLLKGGDLALPEQLEVEDEANKKTFSQI
jgi:hypothetical protein